MTTKKSKEDYIWNKYDNMPTAYKDYQQKLKTGTIKINAEVKRRLSRFPYRYRLAKSFIGIDAKEVGRTLIGYEAGMKVFLAYTAYEDLIYAARKLEIENVKDKNENTILNKELAEQLLKNKSLIDFVRNNLRDEDAKLKMRIEEFIRGETYDVLFLAFAIRNFYAHGIFTATKGGVTKKADKALYYKLADVVLKYCDKRFTNCIKKIWG
ncbi:hypothetical protein [Polynucleobacter asymbioticus]|uniref:Uncharacterized protein n=1 Tax=Polynucleobacter asymbioticus (strain DSM 18221 / CIP 109841 / QLW-P1DMWA-1) TaxID=312153 RepID=A4SZY5_POLAQ|nr:hypothetical protein [Polynucleobacter asymbioticus]ABP35049.1 hypothetical protein Pnuc_1836 [Polynucleobacter asymbioticus QLW-P1DMWA-1]